MEINKIRITTANQSRFAMPAYAAFAVRPCAAIDAPVRKQDSALFEGAVQGTSVWSSPPG